MYKGNSKLCPLLMALLICALLLDIDFSCHVSNNPPALLEGVPGRQEVVPIKVLISLMNGVFTGWTKTCIPETPKLACVFAGFHGMRMANAREMLSIFPRRGIFNIAHRGARSLAPENTICAAKKALELGADMWELDVGMTADEQLIVHHDKTLKRTSNVRDFFRYRWPWYVHRFTLEEIRSLDFGSWYAKIDPFGQIASGVVSGEEIKSFRHISAPTLREALTFTSENDWLVNVEIKNLSGTAGHACVVEKTLALVEELEMTGKVLLSSFNHSYLHRARILNSKIALGVLVERPVPNPVELLQGIGANAYHPAIRSMRDKDVTAVLEKGYDVFPWVANDPNAMRNLVDRGVTGIFTDFPQVLREVIA